MGATTFSLFHIFAGLSCRSETQTAFSRDLLADRRQVGLYGLALLLTILATELGFLQRILGTHLTRWAAVAPLRGGRGVRAGGGRRHRSSRRRRHRRRTRRSVGAGAPAPRYVPGRPTTGVGGRADPFKLVLVASRTSLRRAVGETGRRGRRRTRGVRQCSAQRSGAGGWGRAGARCAHRTWRPRRARGGGGDGLGQALISAGGLRASRASLSHGRRSRCRRSGLAAGALTFFAGDAWIDGRGGAHRAAPSRERPPSGGGRSRTAPPAGNAQATCSAPYWTDPGVHRHRGESSTAGASAPSSPPCSCRILPRPMRYGRSGPRRHGMWRTSSRCGARWRRCPRPRAVGTASSAGSRQRPRSSCRLAGRGPPDHARGHHDPGAYRQTRRRRPVCGWCSALPWPSP